MSRIQVLKNLIWRKCRYSGGRRIPRPTRPLVPQIDRLQETNALLVSLLCKKMWSKTNNLSKHEISPCIKSDWIGALNSGLLEVGVKPIYRHQQTSVLYMISNQIRQYKFLLGSSVFCLMAQLFLHLLTLGNIKILRLFLETSIFLKVCDNNWAALCQMH